MMKMKMLMKWMCMIILSGSLVSAYNIEDRLPLYKRGEQLSTFGFSVVMHKTRNATEDTGSVESSMLVIGGPTSKALESQPNTRRPGGIYTCPVSTLDDDCTRIEMDNGESTRLQNKTDQWLGVNIKSRGPGLELITCAHRFSGWKGKNELEKQQVCGKCFLLNGTGSNSIVDVTNQYTESFLTSPCARRGGFDKNGFAYTQAGTAIEFVGKDYFLGGPGSYAWSGGIYGYPMPKKFEDTSFDDFFEDGIPPRDNKMFGSPGCADRELNQRNKVKCNRIPLRRDSYIGFSMTTSKAMDRTKEVFYIAGAPRGNFTGTVIMYKREDATSKIPKLTVLQDKILMGEHVGSSFGYSVIATDLNNDGFDDLVVGSPQYYERTDVDDYGGAIYIYINKHKPRFSSNPVQKVVSKPESFFGHSLAKLGDIDQDGFNDFAVSSPFHGSGKVYIYRGSADGKVKLSQTLEGKDYTALTPKMKGFGLSLSGNVDIDNNRYPDLLVGTLKDQAILFRSRPIISVDASLILSTELIDLQTPDCRLYNETHSCFYLQACFEYKSRHSEVAGELALNYVISLDSKKAKERKHSRVRFSSPTGSSFKSGTTVIPRSDLSICLKNETVYYRSRAQDKLRPIDIYFGFSLVSDGNEIVPETKGDPVTPMINDPILDKGLPSAIVKTVKIKTDCGDDGCQSDLQISGSVPPELIAGNKDQEVMKLKIQNPGEEAHQASISVKLPQNVFFSGYNVTKPSGANIICSSSSSISSSTFVECEVGNPYPGGSSDEIEIYLDVTSLNTDIPDGVFQISGSTTSNNSNSMSLTLKSSIIGEMALSLTGYGKPQQVRYSNARILGESAIDYWEQIGPLITHTFIVKNEGTSIANNILLNVHFPYEIKNGKWLLYLVSTKVTVGADVLAGSCSEQFTNPLKYEAAGPDTRMGRKKRDIEEADTSPLYSPKTSFQSGSSLSLLRLNCKDNTARCVTIQCSLTPLSSGRSVSIYIKSRLWNATFLEEFKNVDLVYVGVDADLSCNQSNIRIIGNQTTKQIDTTVDHAFFHDQVSSTFPWWYILIGILIALIIYALIIYLLIRCGFFKRKERRYHVKPSDTEELVEERRRNAEERM